MRIADHIKKYDRLTKLLKQIDRFFDDNRISDEERFRIGNRLSETITLDLLGRINDQLSEIDKEEFTSLIQVLLQNPDKAIALQSFVENIFSSEERQILFLSSVENVLEEFLKKVKV